MTTKISGTDGIDVAQIRAADGDPVAITISGAGVVALPATPATASAVVLSANKSTSQTINSLTDTILIGYAAPVVDTLGTFNITTGLYTPNKAGWYLVCGQVRYTTPSNADIVISGIKKNGTTVKENLTKGNSGLQYFECTALVYLNGTTDYVGVHAAQHAAGTLGGVQGSINITYVGS